MKWRVLIACASSLVVACLGTPDTPQERSTWINTPCGAPNEEPVDTAHCRQLCAVTRDCPRGLFCTYTGRDYTGRDTRACLDYPYCSYLDSDTECAPSVPGDPTSCQGNARRRELRLFGDPACGRTHPVRRCQPTPDGCALVDMITFDVGSH